MKHCPACKRARFSPAAPKTTGPGLPAAQQGPVQINKQQGLPEIQRSTCSLDVEPQNAECINRTSDFPHQPLRGVGNRCLTKSITNVEIKTSRFTAIHFDLNHALAASSGHKAQSEDVL
jgi:hypothetical protein